MTASADMERVADGHATALEVDAISAGYGRSLVVRDVSAVVRQGEIVVIVGPNGAGKSTFLKALAGVIRVAGGTVKLDGKDVTNSPTDRLAHQGVGYVPQVNDVFPDLTVKENLLMGGYLVDKKQRAARIEEIIATYPLLGNLIKRRVLKLSGGERKLVAIGRALMNHPRVLLLDEPSAGLAPALAREILGTEIGRLAASDVAILLVEQRAVAALEVADWSYVLAGGRCVLSSDARALLARDDLGEIFLGNVGSGSARSAGNKQAERSM